MGWRDPGAGSSLGALCAGGGRERLGTGLHVHDLTAQTPLPNGRIGPARVHPAFTDVHYRSRRDRIAALAQGHRVGEPSPYIAYTDQEHATWHAIHTALAGAYGSRVSRRVKEAAGRAPIPAGYVPQHAEVGDQLHAVSGFRFTVAGGIVPTKRFLGAMADGYFHAVQYVRHPRMPLYTPEPDVLHDVLGHGIHLCDPWFANLYRAVGRAAMRVDSADALDLLSRIYWYTLEYGVVREDGQIRAYGAALLSSYGELARFQQAEIRPWNPAQMLLHPYRVDGYQPTLFAAESMNHLADSLHAFLEGFDENICGRYRQPASAHRTPSGGHPPVRPCGGAG